MNNLLSSDHDELDHLLKKLFASFDAGGSVEQIYQRLDLFWARLAMHIRAEQLHLFPAILGASEMRNQTMRVPSPDVVKDKISGLQEDHNFFMRELLSAIKQVRDLRADNQTDLPSRLLGVREIITGVARRLKIHNELEESEVYSWVDEILNEAARADLYAAVLKEIENLPPRFMKPGKPD